MTDPTERRRKRSAGLRLTSLMAASGLALGACEEAANWDQAAPRDAQAPAFAYRTVGDCKIADEIPDEECDKAYAQAVADNDANGPKYDERQTCEEVYGPGQCVPRASQGGGSVWGPLLTGFVIGQMLDGGGRSYRGTGLYREREDQWGGGGGYTTRTGGRLNRDYASGQTTIDRADLDNRQVARQAPPKVQSRSTVVSRSGFGGGSRSYGG